MKRFAMTLAAAAIGSVAIGSAALAQAGLDPVLQALERQGYTEIEVLREQNQIRIEAKNQERERVLVYDARTGALLSDTAEQDRLRDRERDRILDDGVPDQDRDRDQLRDRDPIRDQDRLDDPDQDRTQDQDRDRIN